MKTIALAEVPCEVQDTLPRPDMIGQRVAEVLKKINFPEREKFVIGYSYDGFGTPFLRMTREVVDSETGAPISLGHHVYLSHAPSDAEIARAIFIVIGQYVAHEFAETFKFDGKILFNPHEGERNLKMFKAIETLTEPIPPKPELKLVVDELPEPTSAPKSETGDKKHPFAKFIPTWARQRSA